MRAGTGKGFIGQERYLLSNAANDNVQELDGISVIQDTVGDEHRAIQTGRCYGFSSAGTVVDVPRPYVPFSNYDFSLSLWIRTTRSVGEDEENFLFSAGLTVIDGVFGFRAYINNSGYVCFCAHGNSSESSDTLVADGIVCNDGNWHHLVFTSLNNTGIKIYIDKDYVKEGEAPCWYSSNVWNGNTLFLGMLGASHYVGDMMDFRIFFDKTLEDWEIKQLKNFERVAPEKLVLFLKMDEGDGDIVYDSSGLGYHGIIYNKPSDFHSRQDLFSFPNEVGYSEETIDGDEVTIPRDENNIGYDFSGKAHFHDVLGNSLQHIGRAKYSPALIGGTIPPPEVELANDNNFVYSGKGTEFNYFWRKINNVNLTNAFKGSFTVSCWAMHSSSATNINIINISGDSSYGHLALSGSTSSNDVSYSFKQIGTIIASGTYSITYSTDEMVHFVYCVDYVQQQIRLYTNGSLSHTNSFSTVYNGAGFTYDNWDINVNLTYDSASTANRYAGTRIYDKALTATEITQLYTTGDVYDGLTNWWPMREGGGKVAYDVVGGIHASVNSWGLTGADGTPVWGQDITTGIDNAFYGYDYNKENGFNPDEATETINIPARFVKDDVLDDPITLQVNNNNFLKGSSNTNKYKYVDVIENNSDLNTALAGSFSMSYWLDWNGVSGVDSLRCPQIWGRQTAEGSILGILYFYPIGPGTAIRVEHGIFATGYFSQSISTSVTYTGMHLYTLVCNHSLGTNQYNVYVDGVSVATATYQNNGNSIFSTSGAVSISSIAEYNGKQGDTRIYDKALTGPEVTQLYQTGDVYDGLVSWWPMREGGGGTIYDVIGGRHATAAYTHEWRNRAKEDTILSNFNYNTDIGCSLDFTNKANIPAEFDPSTETSTGVDVLNNSLENDNNCFRGISSTSYTSRYEFTGASNDNIGLVNAMQGSLTMSLWLEYNGSEYGEVGMYGYDSGGSVYSILNVYASSASNMRIRHGRLGTFLKSMYFPATITANVMHLFTGVYNHASGEYLAYMDGALIGTFSFQNTGDSIFTAGGSIKIVFARTPGEYQGDTRLYDKALTATEVTQLYQTGDVYDGLVSWWPAREGDGKTLYDVVGGRHATTDYDHSWTNQEKENTMLSNYDYNAVNGFNKIDGVNIPAKFGVRDVLGGTVDMPEPPQDSGDGTSFTAGTKIKYPLAPALIQSDIESNTAGSTILFDTNTSEAAQKEIPYENILPEDGNIFSEEDGEIKKNIRVFRRPVQDDT
jgi:hypothetical protein